MGACLVSPLRQFGNPIADAVAPTQYAEAQSRSDPLYPRGSRYYWKSHNLSGLSDGIIDKLVGFAEEMPTEQCDILIQQLGGKINAVQADATAYPHRQTEFVVTLGGHCETSKEDDKCISWAKKSHTGIGRYGGAGVYVNFLSHDESEDRLLAAYGQNAERLRRIKAKYDPDNFFHVNKNIVPAGD
ncbi:putative oxidoreductase [Chitinispirillum alkaliphilum]|nr:putative oxidoreductase [Chitinispirillum alkaliphilum]